MGPSRGWRSGLWAPVGAGGLARGIEGFAVIKRSLAGVRLKVDWFRLVDLLSTAPGFGVLGPRAFGSDYSGHIQGWVLVQFRFRRVFGLDLGSRFLSQARAERLGLFVVV